MREIERDAFTAATGYPPGIQSTASSCATASGSTGSSTDDRRDRHRPLHRGAATLLASWEEYARGSAGAALDRLEGVSAAVFPSEPERAVYNNALLDRDLGPTTARAAIIAMDAAYGSAGVDRYAAWVHETDDGMRAELSGRGYTLAETTRAMGMCSRTSPPCSPSTSSCDRTGPNTSNPSRTSVSQRA